MSNASIAPGSCSCLRARTLFYPSSGKDVQQPVDLFHPWINEFWFADVNYGPKRNPQLSGCALSGTSVEEVCGRTIHRGEPFTVTIYTEHFLHNLSGRPFSVHYCEGRGYDTFRSIFKARGSPVSIFFYRGDSPGESGSGFWWLGKQRLKNILEVLEPNGLIVTDGSNAEVRELRKFRNSEIGSEAAEKVEPFTFASRHIECVGYVGERYGPTLVWKVKSAESSRKQLGLRLRC